MPPFGIAVFIGNSVSNFIGFNLFSGEMYRPFNERFRFRRFNSPAWTGRLGELAPGSSSSSSSQIVPKQSFFRASSPHHQSEYACPCLKKAKDAESSSSNNGASLFNF